MCKTKRFLCLALAMLLLAGLVPTRTDAAESVYFTAVNDTLLDLSDDTMPFWSGGALYVPSTAIDNNDLGIHYNRSRERGTVVLYKMTSAMTFNLSTGTVETNSGQRYTGTVVLRNDVVFLPLDVICRFFGLEYSNTRISYGHLVRIKSDAVVLSDAVFIDAASGSMAQRYARYERARTPSDSDASPTPSGSGAETAPERTVYLAVESTDAARSAQVLDALSGERAAFLFTPDSLVGADDLLRRLAASGCAVALRIDASSGAEQALSDMEAGNRLLWTAANLKPRLVLLDGAPAETERVVIEAGYCPLHFALNYSTNSPAPARASARILAAADAAGGSCRVLLGTDENAALSLSALLANLRAGNCTPARLNEVVR